MVTQVPSAGARIVVGVDGSAQSKLALSWTVRIAAITGATIDAVTAWHFPMNSGWGYTPDAWNPEADATQCLTDSIDDAFGTERPTGLRLLVREGLPAKVLLDESRGAAMADSLVCCSVRSARAVPSTRRARCSWSTAASQPGSSHDCLARRPATTEHQPMKRHRAHDREDLPDADRVWCRGAPMRPLVVAGTVAGAARRSGVAQR